MAGDEAAGQNQQNGAGGDELREAVKHENG